MRGAWQNGGYSQAGSEGRSFGKRRTKRGARKWNGFSSRGFIVPWRQGVASVLQLFSHGLKSRSTFAPFASLNASREQFTIIGSSLYAKPP